MSYLRKFYDFGKRIIVSALHYSQYVYEVVRNEKNPDAGDRLDLGCGHQLLPQWKFEDEKKLVAEAGLIVDSDYYFPSLVKHRRIKVKVQGSAAHLPFAENVCETVTENIAERST